MSAIVQGTDGEIKREKRETEAWVFPARRGACCCDDNQLYPLSNSSSQSITSSPQPEALISSFTSSTSSSSSKLDSLHQLTRLAKRDSLFRRRLIDSKIVTLLLSCVESHDHNFLRENVLSLLLNLSFDDHNKVGLIVEGVVARLVAVISGTAAGNLSPNYHTLWKEGREQMERFHECVQVLSQVMRNGRDAKTPLSQLVFRSK
ncbi:U-box domain-containing protein [Arachis hypogaea]|nr:U-box domain-containing protein [Arachis hypogaea]